MVQFLSFNRFIRPDMLIFASFSLEIDTFDLKHDAFWLRHIFVYCLSLSLKFVCWHLLLPWRGDVIELSLSCGYHLHLLILLFKVLHVGGWVTSTIEFKRWVLCGLFHWAAAVRGLLPHNFELLIWDKGIRLFHSDLTSHTRCHSLGSSSSGRLVALYREAYAGMQSRRQNRNLIAIAYVWWLLDLIIILS